MKNKEGVKCFDRVKSIFSWGGEKKMPAQKIFQSLSAVLLYQGILQDNPNDVEVRELMEEIESKLVTQIDKWGGVENVDSWLLEFDPGHSTPSELKNMDWSWLYKEDAVCE